MGRLGERHAPSCHGGHRRRRLRDVLGLVGCVHRRLPSPVELDLLASVRGGSVGGKAGSYATPVLGRTLRRRTVLVRLTVRADHAVLTISVTLNVSRGCPEFW